MNSARVLSVLNSPVNADVVAIECCFWIPRITMHMCCASITTATPSGFSVSAMQLRISTVRRSCTCSRRANASTTRGILERPPIWPLVGEELQRLRHALGCLLQPFALGVLANLLQYRAILLRDAPDGGRVVLVIPGIAVHLVFFEHLLGERHIVS